MTTTDERSDIERLRELLEVSYAVWAAKLSRDEAIELTRKVEQKLFSLQTNHDDLAKWYAKHKGDEAKLSTAEAERDAARERLVWHDCGCGISGCRNILKLCSTCELTTLRARVEKMDRIERLLLDDDVWFQRRDWKANDARHELLRELRKPTPDAEPCKHHQIAGESFSEYRARIECCDRCHGAIAPTPDAGEE